jgi:hypothetical protein
METAGGTHSVLGERPPIGGTREGTVRGQSGQPEATGPLHLPPLAPAMNPR